MARILIVDDDDSLRLMIQEALSGLGHTFALAATGFEALDKIAQARFDLVIMDRNMPQMSGIQALKTLRSRPEGAALKVLMCTSEGIMADIDEAFEAGATDYIVKPLDIAKLVAKVARHAGTP